MPKAETCAGGAQSPPDWQEILTYFRGSELQNYFTRILEDDLKAIIKPQYVDHIPKAVRYGLPQLSVHIRPLECQVYRHLVAQLTHVISTFAHRGRPSARLLMGQGGWLERQPL